MPAHTVLIPSGVVVIGASASDQDLIEAMRVATRGNRVLRLHAVESLDVLHRVASVCAGYGWSPSFSWPSWGCVDIVDMHLGGGL